MIESNLTRARMTETTASTSSAKATKALDFERTTPSSSYDCYCSSVAETISKKRKRYLGKFHSSIGQLPKEYEEHHVKDHTISDAKSTLLRKWQQERDIHQDKVDIRNNQGTDKDIPEGERDDTRHNVLHTRMMHVSSHNQLYLPLSKESCVSFTHPLARARKRTWRCSQPSNLDKLKISYIDRNEAEHDLLDLQPVYSSFHSCSNLKSCSLDDVVVETKPKEQHNNHQERKTPEEHKNKDEIDGLCRQGSQNCEEGCAQNSCEHRQPEAQKGRVVLSNYSPFVPSFPTWNQKVKEWSPSSLYCYSKDLHHSFADRVQMWSHMTPPIRDSWNNIFRSKHRDFTTVFQQNHKRFTQYLSHKYFYINKDFLNQFHFMPQKPPFSLSQSDLKNALTHAPEVLQLAQQNFKQVLLSKKEQWAQYFCFHTLQQNYRFLRSYRFSSNSASSHESTNLDSASHLHSQPTPSPPQFIVVGGSHMYHHRHQAFIEYNDNLSATTDYRSQNDNNSHVNNELSQPLWNTDSSNDVIHFTSSPFFTNSPRPSDERERVTYEDFYPLLNDATPSNMHELEQREIDERNLIIKNCTHVMSFKDISVERTLNPQHAPRCHFSSSTCAICIDDYTIDSKIRVLPCKHFYHSTCCEQWLEKNPTCPLCKQPIAPHLDSSSFTMSRTYLQRRIVSEQESQLQQTQEELHEQQEEFAPFVQRRRDMSHHLGSVDAHINLIDESAHIGWREWMRDVWDNLVHSR